MKNYVFILSLFCSSLAFASERVVNVFFEPRLSQLAVNTQLDSGESGFIRTGKLILKSKSVWGCNKGCLVKVETRTDHSFDLTLSGRVLHSVSIDDSENLLDSTPFSIDSKRRLIFQLP